MSWERGRADIERLIAGGELERVTPSQEVADRLLHDAEAHIRLASKGIDDDPAGALQLSYDAARKASAALLAIQGLRSTTRGGHIAVIDTVRAQFNDRTGMEVFGKINRLRRRRNTTEYPSPRFAGRDERRCATGTGHRPRDSGCSEAAPRERQARSVRLRAARRPRSGASAIAQPTRQRDNPAGRAAIEADISVSEQTTNRPQTDHNQAGFGGTRRHQTDAGDAL